MTDVKLLLLQNNTWNHLLVCKKKQTQIRLKIFFFDVFTNHVYLIYMYE